MNESQIPVAPPIPSSDFLATKALKGPNKDYKLSSEDIDLVHQNLYIGSLEAACNVENLKKLNITYVLTVENNPLNEDVIKEFKYKFLPLYDFPSADILGILEECIEFIDEGTSKGSGVLVHCLVGMSRSASIVIAYLMSKNKTTLKETIDYVRKNRYVRPNMGFHRQLEMFESMSFKIDRDSMLYKSYRLEKMAEEIQNGARFSELFDASLLKDAHKNIDCYKCKKCRTQLFTVDAIIPHLKTNNNNEINSNKWNKAMLAKNLSGDEKTICNDQLFIEPQKWFADILSEVSGKLACPNLKCGAKLGTYDWCGAKCECGNWVVPAIHIHSSKVDFCKIDNASLFINRV